MNLKVTFQEQDSSFNARFGEVNTVSDGGYERGYAAGYEDGVKSVPDYLAMRADGMSLTYYESDSITSVYDYAFAYTKNLKTVELPNVNTIGSAAFASCDSLERVCFPKCTSIANYGFQHDKSLMLVDLPSIKTIRSHVFHNCTALKTVILSGDTVCSLLATASFMNTPIANGTGFVYVPDNLVDSYKTANNWSTYASQIKPLSELTGG